LFRFFSESPFTEFFIACFCGAFLITTALQSKKAEVREWNWKGNDVECIGYGSATIWPSCTAAFSSSTEQPR
jgi:hypothetical protein